MTRSTYQLLLAGIILLTVACKLSPPVPIKPFESELGLTESGAEPTKNDSGNQALERPLSTRVQTDAVAHDSGFLLIPGVTIERKDGYVQRYELEASNLHELRITTRETYEGSEFTDTDTFTAAFEIVTVGTRFADEFIVGGETARGWGVIERWRRFAKAGTPHSTASAPTPPGQPTSPVTFTETFVGGTFIPPSGRHGQRQTTREELIPALPSVPVPDSIGVDPEGRHLLVIAEDGNLYQIDLTAQEPTLDLVFSATEIPQLTYVCSMKAAQHSTIGRLWFVFTDACGGSAEVVLFDYNNDGILDDFLVEDALTLYTSDYMNSELISYY